MFPERPHGDQPLTLDPQRLRKLSQARTTQAALVVLPAVALLWVILAIDSLGGPGLGALGLRPGEWTGMIGILTAPLLHGSVEHLFANSFPLLVLGMFLGYTYPRAALRTLAFVWLLGGLCVWLFAREVTHIGASGVSHGLMSYLLLVGILRRDRPSMAISLIVAFLYGGMLFGVIPDKPGISWESHLYGAIAGVIAALLWFRLDRPLPRLPYSWELEPESEIQPDYDAFEPPSPKQVTPLWPGPGQDRDRYGTILRFPERDSDDDDDTPPPRLH